MSIFSVEGVGILNFLFKLFRRKGKIVLHQSVLTINYYYKNLDNLTSGLILDLQFLNNSLDQAIISDFSARFYDGADFHEIFFDKTNQPADKLEAKSPKDISFKLSCPTLIRTPLINIYDKTAHLDLRYRLNGKNRAVFIDDIRLIQDNSTSFQYTG